jgi:large subunit ribosomal protein L25
MSDISLQLSERTMTGKKAAKLRREGLIPSVVYGGKAEPLSTQSAKVETTKVAYAAGKHTPVHLVIDGKKKLAIIKNIDIDPVKHAVRHIEFHTIKQNEAIVTEVPIVLTGEGESAAERAGLIVLQALERVNVKALPSNLPESLELSIVNLTTADDKLTLADITLPAGVEFADVEQDKELVIANVYEPSALQAANETAGGEAEASAAVPADNGEAADTESKSVA